MKLLLGFAIAAIPVAFFVGVWVGMKLADKDIQEMREHCDKRVQREARW